MKDLDNILVIDTVGDMALVALNGKVVSWEGKRSHSEQVLVRIDSLLKEQKIKPESLRGVAVTVGPSTSFTGVRVGITVANGLGFGLNIPVAGVSEFDIIAAKYPKVEWKLLDAKRDEMFFAYKKTVGLIAADKVSTKLKVGESVYMPATLLKTKFALFRKAGTIYMEELDVDERAALILKAAKLPRSYQQVLPLYLREANITRGKTQKPIKN